MALTKDQAIGILKNTKKLFVPYSAPGRLPFVVCDSDSGRNMLYVFDSQEGLDRFGAVQRNLRNLILGKRYKTKEFPLLYGMIYSLGVDSLVLYSGNDQTEVELQEVFTLPDYSKKPEEKRPLFNRDLQVAGIYFTQACCMIVSEEEQKDQDFLARRDNGLMALQNVLMETVKKSTFLLAQKYDPRHPELVRFPSVVKEDGRVFQSVFSDTMELQRTTGGKGFDVSTVTFDKLGDILVSEASAIVINPLGINLVLPREQLLELCKKRPGGLPLASRQE